MSDEAKTDMSFATTQELIDELASRSEALSLAVLLKADTKDAVQLHMIGTRLLCRGLIADLTDRAQYSSEPVIADAPGEDHE